ncbi:hypothetical protein CRUP_008229, partial [Coryphaenoides rupestris]
ARQQDRPPAPRPAAPRPRSTQTPEHPEPRSTQTPPAPRPAAPRPAATQTPAPDPASSQTPQAPSSKRQEALKMQRCFGLFCVSLVFCATLSETIGLVIAAKEKRGWTLNSAGYLLGPRALRIADEDIVHTIMEFLSYLKLKAEIGAFENLPSSLTSEELNAER